MHTIFFVQNTLSRTQHHIRPGFLGIVREKRGGFDTVNEVVD
jgi:hypothetical protein